MFDTNAYNHFLDSHNCLSSLPYAEYYCTYQQYDELIATPIESRRKELIALFHKLGPIELPVETFVLDNARLGKTRLGNGEIYTCVRDYLDHIKVKKNNIQDAIIAEVASVNCLTLVTGDESLFDACIKFGVDVKHLREIW